MNRDALMEMPEDERRDLMRVLSAAMAYGFLAGVVSMGLIWRICAALGVTP